MFDKYRFSAVLVLLFVLVSCGDNNNVESVSTDVPNNSLFADIIIEQVNNNTGMVTALLAVGGSNGTGVDLISGEQFEVNVNNDVVVLTRDSNSTLTLYIGEVALPDIDQLIIVDLIRSISADITDSDVIISSSFELSINAPLQASSTSTITWQQASNATMTFVTAVTCNDSANMSVTDSFTQSFTDVGLYEINLNNQIINDLDNVDRTQNCTANISASRETVGDLSTDFGSGGSIVARRVQQVENISVNPTL